MKKLFILIFSLFTFHFSLFTFAVHAAATITPKPTSQESAPTAESQINKLKDRIASRVAELKLVERRGIIGSVAEITNTSITLSDIQNATRIVDVDELTKFSSPSAKGSFGISDIAKDTKLGVLGLYNKQTRHLLARFVDVLTLQKVIHAVVQQIDKEAFTINVATEKETIFVDVQTTTKTSSYTTDSGLVRSGFSKIKVGQRILVVGFPYKTDETKILPSRITIFPDLARNPKITIATESANKIR